MLPRKTIIYATEQQDADFGAVFAGWCGMADGEEIIEHDWERNSALFEFLVGCMPESHQWGYFPITIICCDKKLITPKLREFVCRNVVGFVDAVDMWSSIEMPEYRVPVCCHGDVGSPVPWGEEERLSLCPFVYDEWSDEDRAEFTRQCRYERKQAACVHKDEFKEEWSNYVACREVIEGGNYIRLNHHFFETKKMHAHSIKISSVRKLSDEALCYKRTVYAKMVDFQKAADHPLTFDEVAELLSRCHEVRFTTLDSHMPWSGERVSKLVGKDELNVRDDWNRQKAAKLLQSGASS